MGVTRSAGGKNGNVSKHIWIALIAGFGASVLLFCASYATHGILLFWLQCAGFFICAALRGFDSATKTDYAEIAIPINAAIYAVLIFLLLRRFQRADSK